MYQIRIKKSAEKELSKLSLSSIKNLHIRIATLAENPFPNGFAKLKGYERLYRIRVGDYRILYTVEQGIMIVEILKIGHRKDIYR